MIYTFLWRLIPGILLNVNYPKTTLKMLFIEKKVARKISNKIDTCFRIFCIVKGSTKKILN